MGKIGFTGERTVRIFVWAAILFFLVVGCQSPKKDLPDNKIEDIEKILFMGKGSYAVFVQHEGEVKQYYLNANTYKVRVRTDAMKGVKPWVEYLPDGKTLVLHLHSVDEISGR